jgi:hypothetical protein
MRRLPSTLEPKTENVGSAKVGPPGRWTLSIRDQREEYLSIIIVGQCGTTGKRRRAIERGVKPVFVAGIQGQTESAIANHVLEAIIIAERLDTDVESGDDIPAGQVAATR